MTDPAQTPVDVITVEQLVAIIGEPAERARRKVRPSLDEADRAWLARSPLCLLATADAAGRCDVSPKGDPPGSLVHVVDEVSSRINGRARLVADAPWFAELTVAERRPVLALLVDIEEVFGHCAKSLVRGRVWYPQTWEPSAVTDVSATARERRTRGEATDLVGTVEQIEAAQLAAYGVPLY
jgi:predicted pyridoxine 5'-phosphate oxidase superfamily flavin-nucleotide-binding protein